MSGILKSKGRGLAVVLAAVTTIGVGVAASGTAVGAGPETSPTVALSAAKAPTAQLTPTRTVNFRGATITNYQQSVGGVPVFGGQVSVISGNDTAPTVVSDDTTALPSAAKAATAAGGSVSGAKAIAIATAATGASKLRAKPTSSLVIDPKTGSLVRRVVLPSGKPFKDFEVMVDATSGAVVSTRNMLQNATGKAKVFTPNPVAENGGYNGIGTTRKADHHDKDTAKLTSLRRAVTLFDLKSHQHCLNGKYVQARLGKKAKPVCKRSLNWSGVTRSNDKFEALEAYSQIEQIASYYHALGFKGNSNFHPKQQLIVADAIPDDNSFYSPGDRKIRYGTGGVDDAEDGDVVVHEYGHSIQDAQVRGFGTNDQAGALGEGFGDYQSALNTALTPGLPDYASAEYCVFDWDGTGGYGGPGVKPCGRLATGADGTNTFTQAKQTCSLGHGREEVHCLGEVWSHGLIDLMNNLPLVSGVPPVAVDVIFSQFAYSKGETFTQAVDDLVAADQAVFSGTHIAGICAEMKTARGINAPSCP